MSSMKHAHFVGIGGVGMSALAVLAKQKGMKVTGSDDGVYFTDKIFGRNDISWTDQFKVENLSPKPDMVVVSAAYDEKNVEVAEAKKLNIPVIPYSEMLAKIMEGYRQIAVAGIHGKTTTSAILAYLLDRAKMGPSFLIGCREVPDLKTNARLGEGEYFVVEADEYKKSFEDKTAKFLDFKPEIVVITSIEMDHPDIYGSEEEIYRAFYKLACKVPRVGFIVGCIDSPRVKKLALSLADRKMETYGFSMTASWKIVDYKVRPGSQIFSIRFDKITYGPFELQIPGKHNVLNATAAFVVCKALGVAPGIVQKYLKQFKGVERRFQIMGEKDGVKVIEDYAHHPTAIATTLEGAREFYPKAKIWCVFQPHTYSRTKELLDDFAKSFGAADSVIINDIYASAREKSGRIHAKHLVAKAQGFHRDLRYIGGLEETVEYLNSEAKSGDIVIVMGAGDVFKVGEKFLKKDE